MNVSSPAFQRKQQEFDRVQAEQGYGARVKAVLKDDKLGTAVAVGALAWLLYPAAKKNLPGLINQVKARFNRVG